jgi:hypothetical protein
VNACSFSGFCEGAVLNPKNHATSVARVIEAALPLRFFAVPGSLKVRTFAPEQRGSLFGFGLLRGHAAKPRLSDFFPRFFRPFVPTVCLQSFGVPLRQVLKLRQTLQVVGSVVRSISVDVMYLLTCSKRVQPASGDNTVHQALAAKAQVAVASHGRGVRVSFSENFPASGNSKQVVEDPVFNAVNDYAVHGVNSKMIAGTPSYLFSKEKQSG